MRNHTIGILAETTSSSAAPFLELVRGECRRARDAAHDREQPKLLVCSPPAPLTRGGEIDPAALEAATLDGVRTLANAGADVIAVAGEAAHVDPARLADAVAVPVLDSVAVALEALPAGTRRVAIAASGALGGDGPYPRAARARGLDVIAPAWQPHLDRLRALVNEGAAPAACAGEWERAFGCLDRSVDAVIVASLDLSAAVPQARSPSPLVDAARALATRVGETFCARTPPRESWIDTARGRYTISTDKSRLDLPAIHAYLSRSYWAAQIPRALVARSIAASLCFGLYDPAGAQVGLARVVTDYATFAYLCDVYVLEEQRGLGLGKALVAQVVGHPQLAGIRRALLATRDAHGLYAQSGFKMLARPHRYMEINHVDLYARPPAK